MTDVLHFGIYRQHFRTWWYDSDGDENDYGTVHATLRFYEDGTVIGISSKNLPKLEVEKTFTLKGNWELDKNKLTLHLEKVSEVDDSIDIYISPEEERNMKY